MLISIVGEQYEYTPYYIEETRRFGASRRINPNLELSRLTRESRMILAHPRVINTLWEEQTPPQECQKHIPLHDMLSLQLLDAHPAQKEGPCISHELRNESVEEFIADQVSERCAEQEALFVRSDKTRGMESEKGRR